MLRVLLPLAFCFLTAPTAAIAGAFRPAWSARLAAFGSACAFVSILWGWSAGGGEVRFPWAPAWNLHFDFTLDGPAALYALLATGVGFAVVVYSAGYIPRHLHQQKRPPEEATRFYVLLTFFMASMVGLAMAQDLLLLFVFFDLTALASYFLIAYDRKDPKARAAAFMALLVTGSSGILLLIASLILGQEYGSFRLPEIISRVGDGPTLDWAAALIVIAALAKSAQVPLHFWLPKAMIAPTPVSAYLHSAAMVAAGIFLLLTAPVSSHVIGRAVYVEEKDEGRSSRDKFPEIEE